MNLTKDDIRAGNVYEAKRKRPIGFFEQLFNDRVVLWISATGHEVQYDGPEIAIGKKRPVVSMEKFLRWVKRDVTKIMPEDEWRKYE